MKLIFDIEKVLSGNIVLKFPEGVSDEEAKSYVQTLLKKGEIYDEDFKNLEETFSVSNPRTLFYDVEIREFYSRIVPIKADSQEDALDKAHVLYHKQDIVLNEEDFVDVDIEIFEENV